MTMKVASVELENSLSLAAITVYWIWSDVLLVTCVHFALVYNPDRRHGHRTRGCLHPGPSACPDKWDRSLCPHLPPHLPQTRSPLSLHQSLRLNYLLPHHHHHLPLHLHHLFHPLFPSLRDERIYISCHLKKALVINKFTLRNTYSVIQRTCLPLNLLWTSNIYSLSISVNNCENQKMNHVQ